MKPGRQNPKQERGRLSVWKAWLLFPVWFWAASIPLALSVWLSIGVLVYFNERGTLAEAAQARRSLARSLAERQEGALRAVDVTLQALRETWLSDPARFGAAVERHLALLHDEQVLQVLVLDRDGGTAFSKLPRPSNADFADRQYFQHRASSSQDALHISEPLFGRSTGQWVIVLSRPIRDRGNRFHALVAIAVAVPALERTYPDTAAPGARSLVALVRSDGRVLAGSELLAKSVGVSGAGTPGLARGGDAEGEFEASGSIDAIDRYVTYRQLRNYPLTVYVGQSTDALLAPHRQNRVVVVAATLLGTAMLFGISALLFLRGAEKSRTAGTEARLRAELHEGERRLSDHAERTSLELHDGSIQSIYGVGLQLEQARKLMSEDPVTAAHAIAEAQARLNIIIQDLRDLISDSEARSYSAEHFAHEVHSIVADLAPPPVDCSLAIDPQTAAGLTPGQAAHALRIIREAVSNAGRHAGANRMRIVLARSGARIRLEVSDDGVGIRAAGADGRGLGLQHLNRRAKKLGGFAMVESAVGTGTRIAIEFPAAD